MQTHYFQRYHSKENVDTSNTILMFSRLYNYSPDKFFSFLNEIILQNNDSPEVSFILQPSNSNSIPDAVISQKSFKVVVETKLYNQFNEQQLVNHLNSFENENIKVLLSLDPRPMKEELLTSFSAQLQIYNNENKQRLITPIKHRNLTFAALIDAITEVIDWRDYEMFSVLEDFRRYCFDEKLIPDEHKWMRAIVAGTTIQDNIELNLYYDQAERGYTDHGYIGLYNKKSICAIGKLKKTVLAVEKNGSIDYTPEAGEEISVDEKARIEEAISRSENYGYDLKTISHRYFLVEKFYPTDFRKTSPYAIQRSKYFNLADMLGCDTMPEIGEIAKQLSGRSWEDFS